MLGDDLFLADDRTNQ